MRTITRVARSARVIVVALVAVPAAGFPGGSSAAAGRPTTEPLPPPPPPQEYAADDASFYQPPDPLPAGIHGDLLRFQVAADSGGERRYRIMYLSETVAGAPTAVTGLVDVPGQPPPFGGFDLILDGHGSTGLADRCAPSRLIDEGSVPLGIDGYGGAALDTTVIASTDGEGLGGPGGHAFLVGVSGGRSILDAGRAARQLPGVYVGDRTGIVGFSEGGHAALWATQLAAAWTPEQAILGSVIAAPASEVDRLVGDNVGSPEFEAVALGIVAGLGAAYPDAEAALGSVTTATGRDVITAWRESTCFFEPATDSAGPFLSADPTTVEPFASLIAANVAGTVAAPTPMLVIHATDDERIPFAHNQVLIDRLCGAGQVVQNMVIPGTHVNSAVEATRTGIDWLAGLASGGSPTSSCGG